jgi:hypothetical protein
MRTPVTVAVLAMALGFVLRSDVLAQESLAPGTRVRVTAPSFGLTRYRGTVRSVARESLVVDSLTIPLASVTMLEIGRFRAKETLVGTAVGSAVGLALGRAAAGPGWGGGSQLASALAGGVTGAAIGASPKHAMLYGGIAALTLGGVVAGSCVASCPRHDSDLSFDTYLRWSTGAAVGAGLLLGALVGAVTHPTEWRYVPVEQLGLTFSRTRDGAFAVGVQIHR